MVPKNSWLAASTTGEYSLVGCTLAPGFEYDDFELANPAKVIAGFPHLEYQVRRFA